MELGDINQGTSLGFKTNFFQGQDILAVVL